MPTRFAEDLRFARVAVLLTSRLRSRQIVSAALRLRPLPRFEDPPHVIVWVSNYNTRDALELTLRSMLATAGYPNYEVIVTDSGSSDGSQDLVLEMGRHAPILLAERVRSVGEDGNWGPFYTRHSWTKYWVHVDSDVWLIGRGWLAQLVSTLEDRPLIDLLAAEMKPALLGYREPIGHRIVDQAPRYSTWLHAWRTSMRDRFEPDFGYHVEPGGGVGGRDLFFDGGAKLLRDLQAAGLGFAVMPPWFRFQYYHWGNLSWAGRLETGLPLRRKQLQLWIVAALAARYRERAGVKGE